MRQLMNKVLERIVKRPFPKLERASTHDLPDGKYVYVGLTEMLIPTSDKRSIVPEHGWYRWPPGLSFIDSLLFAYSEHGGDGYALGLMLSGDRDRWAALLMTHHGGDFIITADGVVEAT